MYQDYFWMASFLFSEREKNRRVSVNYLIIGNGVAGIEAALAIRETDRSASVRVISRSAHPFYYRPRLVDFIKEDLGVRMLYAHQDEFWAEEGIEVVQGIEAVKVHAHSRKVDCIDGSEFSFDRMLIAVGADPNIPPFDNSSMEGVFSLRGISSAERLRGYCKGKRDIVIAGAGLLGIEIAHALSASCGRITVIDVEPYLLPRQLDRDGAECLRGILESRGLRFMFGDTVSGVEGSGRVERVLLKSGSVIPADALIVSAGVHARTELALNSGISVNNGILVDNTMRTSMSNVYAAGDCAEHGGVCYGLWTIAKEQGRIAGLNMAGVKSEYSGSVPSASLKVTGVDVFSAGNFSADGGTVLTRSGEGTYARIVFDGNRADGAVVVGDSAIVKEARKSMAGKIGLGEMRKIMEGERK
jgi:nitrite reductase (NADH) large subunit